MLILDTDHVGELQKGSTAGRALRDRLVAANDCPATTIVSVEEQMRGWLAAIHGERDPGSQIEWYARLQKIVAFFAAWTVLPWGESAVAVFKRLRANRIRIGTMDLKIAASSWPPTPCFSPGIFETSEESRIFE